MKSNLTKTLFNPIFIISLIMWLYVLIPFFAPIAYVNGKSDLGRNINEFYENFCHQRVERAIYLFGKDKPITFYTVDELKEKKAIPEVNPNPQGYVWPEYFGHDYVGNSEVGYKVPLCIRDIGLYGGIALALSILLLLSKQLKDKIQAWNILKVSILLVPMALDGLFQTVVEMLQIKQIPDWYIASNLKRIITGLLFGIGTAIIIHILISPTINIQEKSLTKPPKKGKIKV